MCPVRASAGARPRSKGGLTGTGATSNFCPLAGYRKQCRRGQEFAGDKVARWRSGYAAACKAVYTGSIPVRASSFIRRSSVGRTVDC